MIWRSLFSFLILGFLLISPALAEGVPKYSTARLIAAVEGTGSAETVRAGAEVKLQPGWKAYWRTPGEAGLPPTFIWSGSQNLKSATVLWPQPLRFVAFDINNFGYEDEVIFPIDAVLEKPGAPLSLVLKLDLLVCSEICVPETHHLTLDIPAGESRASAEADELVRAMAKVPSTAEEDRVAVRSVWLETGDDGKNYLRATAEGALTSVDDVFIEHPSHINTGKPEISYDGGVIQIVAPIDEKETIDNLRDSFSAGALTLTIVSGGKAYERQITMAGEPVPAQQPVLPDFDPRYLLLAFLGGLILNLMPCVLPVLSLKVLSVLSHGGKDHRLHRASIFKHFMVSAAGILFSFWLLAGGLIALKSAGHTIGWGIQFQHPVFLVFLIIVLFAFAANMWGLFEIPLPRFIARNVPARHEHQPTLAGDFLTGAFATLLATPCTAPFLGTAVGFALAREAGDILIVFTCIGLGLALPYLLLAALPQIFKFMPKPGRWMTGLRRILSLALAITALWLVSVLVTVQTQVTLDAGWTKFDEALIKPAVAEGKTVVVDITADWCLTCKANKRLVLEQKDVLEALSEPNILRLQGDWTGRDETIAAYLKSYGRYGIPFNIVYGPGAPDGIILSELLSKQDVMRALSVAAGE